jgi:hemerythrin
MLNRDEDRHRLGVDEMDATHREFVALVAALGQADDDRFPALFQTLVEHSRLHFAQEGRLMRLTRFPALGEHEGEHFRVLGELLQFNRAIRRGRLALARAYVKSGLPEWFDLHLSTMDAALAAHHRRTQGPAADEWRSPTPAPGPWT